MWSSSVWGLRAALRAHWREGAKLSGSWGSWARAVQRASSSSVCSGQNESERRGTLLTLAQPEAFLEA
jgi:hypothetical protein